MSDLARHRAIEAQLLPAERAVLAAWLDALGLRADGWRAVPGLGDVVESVAVVRVATRIQLETKCSRSRAIERACDQLGVKVEAHSRRLLRWWHRNWKTPDNLSLTSEAVPALHSTHERSRRTPRRAA